MEGSVYLSFIALICGCVSLTVASPPTIGYFVSTEPTKNNEKEGFTGISSLFPVIYEMDIKSNISNRFAKTLVTSKVKNSQTTAKETTFTVILPEKAFISEFAMETGGKSYKAYVKEKEEAKKDYDAARQSGQSAGHVAVSARDSNRFTVSINIEPEAKAVFLLTYEELLERKNEQYELVLNIHPGQVVKRLNVEVLITESRPLKFVRTPSLRSGNEISKEEEKLNPLSNIEVVNDTSVVIFAPDADQQKHFARQLGGNESDGLAGQFVVQYDVERDPHGGEVLLDDGYFIHFFAPSELKPLPKHVIFVLDTSGSMSGRKISQLKDAMKHILDEIKREDIINIVEFENEAKVWDIDSQSTITIEGLYDQFKEPFPPLSKLNLPSPTPVTDETINKAKQIIDKIDANGGTNIIEGLETALYLIKVGQESGKEQGKKYQPIIIFLTDGEPNMGMASTEEITSTVTKINSKTNNVPIFSLSFGEDADKEFMRILSLKNQGFSRHIYEAADASLQLQEFYKEISSPLLSDVTFKYESGAEELTQSHFPIYFRGSEIVVAGKYKDPSLPIVVDCWGVDGAIVLRPTVERPVTSLERLWAYLTVKQTLEKRDSEDDKEELNKKALDLALKYAFVTDVTSLVVVKPNETSKAVNTEVATKDGSEYDEYDSIRPQILRGRVPGPRQYFTTMMAFSGSNNNALGPLDIRTNSAVSSSFNHHQIDWNGGFDLDEYSDESDDDSSVESIATSTTPVPILGNTSPLSITVSNLTNELPWLTSVMNSNGSITIEQGTYDLGECSSFPSYDTECQNNPYSSEDGICTLIQDCPEVHVVLLDVQIYQLFFCSLENRYAGVCCPKKEPSH